MTPSTPPELTWGAGIRQMREIQKPKMTQVELAEKAGTTQVTISRIELGARQVSDALRVRIARALDCNPHDLFPYVEDVSA